MEKSTRIVGKTVDKIADKIANKIADKMADKIVDGINKNKCVAVKTSGLADLIMRENQKFSRISK